MFVDKAKIYVKGGDGGDGLIAFKREKYVAEGGPSGGDGGRGGNVIFVVDEGLRTLIDFKYQRHFKAKRGEKGKVKGMHGAGADDMIVRVPPGTIVVDEDTQEIVADMTEHGQRIVIAKGGKGGRGNMRFASASNPAPYISENGEPGQERYVILELKVMADVGLVGFPSVGKSTLLSVVTAAQPKIGAYHFTTITPNLGVVDVGDGRSFVLADLPGLIEGAHEGVGLGHEFLRHVERTRLILHVIDMAATEFRDPWQDYLQINEELRLYNPKLMERKQIIVANKMDMPDAADNLELFREQMNEAGIDHAIFEISAVSKQGLQQLMYFVMDELETIPATPLIEEIVLTDDRKVYTLEAQDDQSFTIRRENETFVVESPSIENILRRVNITSQDSMMRFARILRLRGVDNALRERGAVDGSTIRIGDYEFEFVEKG
jgi:GTP-binding protein